MSLSLSEIQTKIFRDEVIGHLFASKLCEGGRRWQLVRLSHSWMCKLVYIIIVYLFLCIFKILHNETFLNEEKNKRKAESPRKPFEATYLPISKYVASM